MARWRLVVVALLVVCGCFVSAGPVGAQAPACEVPDPTTTVVPPSTAVYDGPECLTYREAVDINEHTTLGLSVLAFVAGVLVVALPGRGSA